MSDEERREVKRDWERKRKRKGGGRGREIKRKEGGEGKVGWRREIEEEEGWNEERRESGELDGGNRGGNRTKERRFRAQHGMQTIFWLLICSSTTKPTHRSWRTPWFLRSLCWYESTGFQWGTVRLSPSPSLLYADIWHHRAPWVGEGGGKKKRIHLCLYNLY